MSDLAATNCGCEDRGGCGCNSGCDTNCGCNMRMRQWLRM